MKVSALILSDNEIFARMLSHELSYMRIESTLISDLELISDGLDFDILLADLDFAGDGYISALVRDRGALELSGKHNNEGKALVIGWSSVETPEYYSDFSILSAFLHRPFLMSDLRYIIAGYFSLTETPADAPMGVNDDNGYLSYLSRLRRIAELSGKRFDEDNQEARVLSCDSESMTAIYGEKKFPLSEYEYKVLGLLCDRRGEVVTREEISKMLGGEMSNMCDVYICHLRKKIDSSLGLKLILTVRGKGYTVK